MSRRGNRDPSDTGKHRAILAGLPSAPRATTERVLAQIELVGAEVHALRTAVDDVRARLGRVELKIAGASIAGVMLFEVAWRLLERLTT